MAKRKIVMSEFNHIFMLIILLCLLVIGMSIYGTFNKVEHFQEKKNENTNEQTKTIPLKINTKSSVTNGVPVVPTLPKVPIMISSNNTTPSVTQQIKPVTTPSTTEVTTSSVTQQIKPVTTPKVKPEVVEAPKITAPIEVVKETPKPVVKKLDTASSSQTRFMPKTMLQPSYVPTDEVIPTIKATEQSVEKPTEKTTGSKMLSIFKFNF